MLIMAGKFWTRKNALFFMVSGLLILVAAGLFFIGDWQTGPLEKGSVFIGGPAPDFTLPDMAGRQRSLSQFRGQKVLIAFWASWCPPCRAELISLQHLQDNPRADNLTVLAVNAGESREQVSAFLSRHQLLLPVLFDVEGDVQEDYGVFQLPVAFLVDGRGQVASRHLGLRDWNSAEAVAEINLLAKE